MHVTHVVLATPTALLVLALLLCTVTLTLATKKVDGAGEGGGGWGGGGGGGGREREGGTENKNKASERLAAAGRLDGAEGSSELCDNARLQCTVRTGCQMALNNFFLGCSSILSGEERGCTTACQHALVSLLATEDGAGLAFINCNCSVHQQCQERKQRVQVCQRHVLHSMDLVRDHQAAVSCSFARWICEADTSCLAALHYYVQHCSKLFTGTRCTAKCRNSVHILYRQPNAHKLRSCRCEGDEDYDCPSLVTNTERLCFHRHRHQHNDSHHHHHHDDHDYVSDGDGGEFRRPGRRPSPSNTQRHTSGQAAVTSLPYSGPDTAQTRPFRRRKRRNRPRRNKPKSVAWQKDPSSAATKRRRVLKRRAGPRRSKARRTKKKSCGGKGAESRNRRGLERRSKTGGRKKCHLKKSTRRRSGKPQRKTRELTLGGRHRLARRPTFVSAGLP